MRYITLILKNPFRNKTRTALSVIGIAIGIATIVALGLITDGLDESIQTTLNSGGAEITVTGAIDSEANTKDINTSYLDTLANEEIVVDDEKNEVKVTHGGLAGAGVGAGMCRGMGEGVKYVELLEVGGGSKEGKATVVTPKYEKLVIGIDDTDVKDAGATWTMAHNIGSQLKDEGFEYLDHIICQLYPHNPHKTQNCVSIALTFAVLEEDKERLIERLIEILKHDTLSDKTAIAILEGIGIPEKLREYAMATKTGMMDVETAEKVAEDLDIPLIAVTGDQGKVGALAALGLYDDCDEAVKVYY